MESGRNKSTTNDTHDVVKTDKCNRLCNVCGSDDGNMHFGVLCCSSCKIFFRRNAQFDVVSKKLDFLNQNKLILFYVEQKSMCIRRIL